MERTIRLASLQNLDGAAVLRRGQASLGLGVPNDVFLADDRLDEIPDAVLEKPVSEC